MTCLQFFLLKNIYDYATECYCVYITDHCEWMDGWKYELNDRRNTHQIHKHTHMSFEWPLDCRLHYNEMKKDGIAS